MDTPDYLSARAASAHTRNGCATRAALTCHAERAP
jgi:hypothetical protein